MIHAALRGPTTVVIERLEETEFVGESVLPDVIAHSIEKKLV